MVDTVFPASELKAFKKNIEETTIQRFETPFDAPSNWWQDAYRLEDGAQAWLITDPEDGRIPPLTPEGRERLAVRLEVEALRVDEDAVVVEQDRFEQGEAATGARC